MMSRIIDVILLLAFIGCLGSCLYVGNIYGERNGYAKGELSVYRDLMGQSVINMAALDQPQKTQSKKGTP